MNRMEEELKDCKKKVYIPMTKKTPQKENPILFDINNQLEMKKSSVYPIHIRLTIK